MSRGSCAGNVAQSARSLLCPCTVGGCEGVVSAVQSGIRAWIVPCVDRVSDEGVEGASSSEQACDERTDPIGVHVVSVSSSMSTMQGLSTSWLMATVVGEH